MKDIILEEEICSSLEMDTLGLIKTMSSMRTYPARR
jgi:hypothetical protein